MHGHIMIDVPSAQAIASTSHKCMRPHVLGGRYVEVVDFTWFPVYVASFLFEARAHHFI